MSRPVQDEVTAVESHRTPSGRPATRRVAERMPDLSRGWSDGGGPTGPTEPGTYRMATNTTGETGGRKPSNPSNRNRNAYCSFCRKSEHEVAPQLLEEGGFRFHTASETVCAAVGLSQNDSALSPKMKRGLV